MPAPSPLTPPDCDLRSFDWFPFFHKRLLKSSFWSRASDQACRISVDFWSVAYDQVPAASLPDDDYLLAEWAGFGRRNVDAWLAVKSEVMEPWVMCSDGRWYHPTLSEVACKAWVERRLHLWKRECERVRKDNLRRKDKGSDPLELPPKPSDDPFDDVVPPSVSEGKAEVPGGQIELSNGHPTESPVDPPDVQRTSDVDPPCGGGFPAENALKGKGRETTPSGILPELRSGPRRRTPGDDPKADLFDLTKQTFGGKSGGFTAKFLKAVGSPHEALHLAQEAIADAPDIDAARAFLGKIIKDRERGDGGAVPTARDLGDAW